MLIELPPPPELLDGPPRFMPTPHRTIRLLILSALPSLAPLITCGAQVAVGTAKIDITPTHPTVLAGYGSRTTEHEGVDRRIFARALAIGDEDPVLLLAVENCGVPASVTRVVESRLRDRVKLSPSHIIVASTHTHSAPSLVGYAPILWAGRTTPQQDEHSRRYTSWLTERLVELSAQALAARSPATLSWTKGRVEFGGNRRVLEKGRWAGFGFQTGAPVDHSLPILVARSSQGKIRAVWTTYACHCTTTGGRNRICGDWAGFASDTIESRHEDSVALLTIGCGADVGPQPSGTLEIARTHGEEIADEVDRCLAGKVNTLAASPTVVARTVALPLRAPPGREELERRARGGGFEKTHAEAMLRTLDAGRRLATHVDLPLSTWTFADELAIVFLGGEVVVDYSVRLQRELDWRRLWINAWCDDVPCYIVSKRVLEEGGYEPGFSMVYYDKPASFAPEVEEALVRAVHDALPRSFRAADGTPPSPYHRALPVDHPRFSRPPKLGEKEREALKSRIARSAERLRRGEFEGLTEAAFKTALENPLQGFAGLVANDGGEAAWYDFSGSRRRRPYIRQQREGATITWKTAAVPEKSKRGLLTFAFLGGLGWESQPRTEGFTLSLEREELLRFDVTRSPSRWSGKNGSQLLYFPTWTSDLDSGGVFLLTLPRGKLHAGRAAQISVRSLGSGSLRWFSVDVYRDAVEIAQETLPFAGRAR